MARTDERFRSTYNRLLDICEALDVGGDLPPEIALADRMSVSRTVVRSALERLKAEQLIHWEGRRKFLVRRPEKHHRLDAGSERVSDADLERKFLDWILRFDVPEGTALNISKLSRQFGVPVHNLQKFLGGLSRFGLVERRARGGWILSGFTAEFALELSDFRQLLEINAVRQFALLEDTHPVWQRLEDLKQEHERLLDDLDKRFQDFSKLDENFHAAINSVVSNRFVDEAQKLISLIFHYHYMWDKTDEKQRNRAAIREHLDIVEALQKRDVACAEEATARHLQSSKTTLLSSLRTHNHG